MYAVMLAFLLGTADLVLACLTWASIGHNQILGSSMLILVIAAVSCHALLFRN
jgi:hypothetical protein